MGKLTLNKSIEIAQDNSAIAESARFSLISSEWQFESFRADLLPSLSLSGNAPNFNKSIFSNTLDDGRTVFSSRTQSEASSTISIDQNILYTGGTLSLSSGLTRLGVFEGDDTFLWQNTPMVVGLEQPIFQFNSLKWRNRIEPLQYEIAQKEFVQEMESIAQSITQSFFDVLLAKINLENAEFNVTRNDSIYTLSQGRYETGSIAENDLLQTELALRNAEAALSQARIEYDRRLNDFKILLGYTTDVELELTIPSELPNIDVNIEKAKQLAIQNNSEALNHRLSEIQANRDMAQAKSEASFSATLNAEFGLNRSTPNLSDIFDNLQNRQFFNIGFDIPIFNWGQQRAEINAARNEQRAVANDIEFQRKQFIQQVDFTVKNFLQLRDQVLIAAQADTIAQRRYDVAQNRYRIGNMDITNLFIAQDERDSARQSYISALRNFWTGWYELRELTLYDFRREQPISYELR